MASLSRLLLLRTFNNFKKLNYVSNKNQLRSFVSSSFVLKSSFSGFRIKHQQQILNKELLNNKAAVRNYSHVPYTKDMIEQRVLLVLRLYDKIDPSRLTLESNFSSDLGLDSLDQVDIVIAMEDEFGFEIPDEDGEFLITPKHVAQYVCDKFDVFD